MPPWCGSKKIKKVTPRAKPDYKRNSRSVPAKQSQAVLGAGVKSTQPAWSQPTAWAHHFSVKSTHLRKVNPSGAKHNGHTTKHGALQHAQFAQNIAHTESMSSFWLKTIVRVKCKTQWAHHKQGVISTCWICTKQCAHWVNIIILFKKSVHVKCKTSLDPGLIFSSLRLMIEDHPWNVDYVRS